MLGRIGVPKLGVTWGVGIMGGISTLRDGAGTLGGGTTTGGGGDVSQGNNFGGKMTVGGGDGLRC